MNAHTLVGSGTTDWFLVALLVGVSSLIGLPMVVRGGSAWRRSGPAHPVTVLIPRRLIGAVIAVARGDGLSTLVSARAAFFIGCLCLLLGLMAFPAVFGFDTFNPMAVYRRNNSGCRLVVENDELKRIGGPNSELARVLDDGAHCHARWRLGEGGDLDVDLGSGGSFPSGTLRERRARNERSRTRGEVTELGDDTLRITGGTWDTVYADLDGLQLRIQTSPGVLNAKKIDALLSTVRKRRGRLKRYESPRRRLRSGR